MTGPARCSKCGAFVKLYNEDTPTGEMGMLLALCIRCGHEEKVKE